MRKKCHAFFYRGWDANGKSIQSYIYAEHLLIAKHHLEMQGIWPKTIHRALIAPRLQFNATDLLSMTEQLTVLVQASLPLIFCLKIIAKQFHSSIANIFYQVIILIEQGKSLSAALLLYPHIFPQFFVRLIQVGEESGQLAEVLLQLRIYQEKMLFRTKALKQALLYPVFVCVVSIVITTALLLFIVPQFQALFADVTTTLPMMTRFVFALSEQLQQIHLIHILVFFLVCIGWGYVLKNNPKTLYWQQEFLHRIPFTGKIIHDNIQIRYLRTLGLALQAGLPLIFSLQLASQVIHSTRLARKISNITQVIQSGLSLHQAFERTAQFNEIVVQLIAIGEQTSQLSTLLQQSAHVLEQNTDKRMQHFLSLLQPSLVVCLGIILGGLIIALYLPVFKLGTLY